VLDQRPLLAADAERVADGDTFDRETATTEESVLLPVTGLGLGWTFQALPFQCSISVFSEWPLVW